MKKFTWIFAGLMTLIFTTLTSCLPESEGEKDVTYYVDDFVTLKEGGKFITTDDNHTFSVENWANFTQAVKEPTDRMFMRLSIVVPVGKTFEQVYDTANFPVSIQGAFPAGVFQVVKEKPEGTPAYTFTTFNPSVNKVFLNCYVYTTIAKKPVNSDFKAYVEKVNDLGEIYIRVDNRTAKSDNNGLGYYGLSFPLNELLSGIELKKDSDGYITMYVNSTGIKVKI